MPRALVLLVLAALACARAPAAWDPVSADPLAVDADFPAALRSPSFESAGARLNGLVYVAQGAGTRDLDTPPAGHHEPLVDALQAASASRLATAVFDADPSFSDKRVALARLVAAWLDERCR